MFWWGFAAGCLAMLLLIAFVLWLLSKGMAEVISGTIVRLLGK